MPGKIELQLKGLFLDDSALPGAIAALFAPSVVADVAPPLQRLLLLNLSDNNLTDAASSTLEEVVSRSHTLRMVDLRGNRITTVGRRVLLQALERNVSVHGVSHTVEITMIEGLRGSDSTGPLRIDIRSTEASDVSAVETITLQQHPNANDQTVSTVSDSKYSARKRRVDPPVSVRRRIKSAQILDSAVYVIASGTQRTNEGMDPLDTMREPQEQNRSSEVTNQKSGIDYEHLINLQLIAGIDDGTGNLLNHEASDNHRKFSDNLACNTGAQAPAVSKKSRPLSAPSLSYRTMHATKKIYEASPFPLPPNTEKILEPTKIPASEINDLRIKIRQQKTDNNVKRNTGSEKRLEGPSAKTKKVLLSISSKRVVDDFEMYNPLKMF